jgi:acyl-ACP thioesterase
VPTRIPPRPWAAAQLPSTGRVHWGSSRVRLGDARPGGRARFDALARLLQDVAEEDARTAGLPGRVGWMVRRTHLSVRRFPRLGEELELATFCSATGSRWAERTTVVVGEHGAKAAARAVWVALDPTTGKPVRLGEPFFSVYGPSAAGRRATLRLTLPAPPPEASGRPWPLRRADLDVWGHANNAVAWAAVEDALPEELAVPAEATLEHTGPLLPTARPLLVARQTDHGVEAWLIDEDSARTLAAARVEPVPRSEPGP